MAGFTPGSKPNLFNGGRIPLIISFLGKETIEDLIREKRFAWTNPKIPKSFKSFKVDKTSMLWEAHLIEIDTPHSLAEAIAASTHHDGWRPGEIQHLMRCSSLDLNNKEKPVVCLGSMREISSLDFMPTTFFSEGTGRIFDLFEEKDFVAGCRFLSVRPSPFS